MAGLTFTELGAGDPVVALGDGFAGSEGHNLLAERFRVIVVGGDAGGALGEAVAAWAVEAGLEKLGILAIGDAASEALTAAEAAGERVRSIVLVSPPASLAGAGPIAPGLRTPKAVLLGTDDASQPRDVVSLWRRALPHCNAVLVYGAGADLATERPRAFADAAGDFLERQARFGFMTESVAVLPA
jgi:pimeloyl-ACP methyl ester carboxylesterase